MFTKPRSDAKLKTLPLARQAEIAEKLRTKRLLDVVDELRSEGINTSSNALSEFHSWWGLKQAALGANIVELTNELHQMRQRLNRRDFETQRAADKARAAIAMLKDESIAPSTLRENLKRLFGIK